MSIDQNKEIVILWLEERSKGNWDIINELFAPDYICHFGSDPEPVRGRDKVKQMNANSTWGFDVSPALEPELLIAEGDMVVHRKTMRFKPTGIFRGNPPTDKEATVGSVDIYRIVNGRIIEQWNYVDRFGLMYQLGNLPIPTQAEPSAE
jgi:predicted SnoaL-like aldol condensation-catalyzing enzyme